jgi:HlyD family secretion protein
LKCGKKNMKKFLIIISVVIVIAVGAFFFVNAQAQRNITMTMENLETEAVWRDTLSSVVGATGTVRSNQSAYLVWKANGQVEQVFPEIGDSVSEGETLATLADTSLPAYIILAQADLVNAEKALETLKTSSVQQADALAAVEAAEKALEDALNPGLAQAEAQAAIAAAEADLDTAETNLAIVTKVVPQSAKDQAYANMLLAEKKLNDLKDRIAKYQRKAKGPYDPFRPWEDSKFFKRIIEGLEMQLPQLQIAYDNSVQKYNNLLAPPDPLDVAVAEAAVFAAQAQLDDALRQYERIKDGASLVDIAVLEAQLADARREYERVKDGAPAEDIAILEAQIAASEATLQQTKITAPFAGTVTLIEVQKGDQVDIGSLAFRLDDLSTLLVDLGVSEIDINLIELGQDVVMNFDAVLAREYHGTVVDIAPVGTTTMGVTNFNVTVELHDADEYIRPGMTSAVDIVTSQVDDVLLIPNRAIRLVDGERVVYVLRDGRNPEEQQSPLDAIVAVPVTLGASSDLYSEVLTGDLNIGDEIVLNPELDNLSMANRGGGITVEINP